MPEGPEVRTITLQLNAKLSGNYLLSIDCLNQSTLTKYQSGFPCYSQIQPLLPAYIRGVTCKGKRIIFILSSSSIECGSEFYITCHLGMSGRWSWTQEKSSFIWFNIKSSHPSLISDHDSFRIYFSDSRRFSNFNFFPDTDSLIKFLNKTTGPDLLAYAIDLYTGSSEVEESDHITEELWRSKIRNGRFSPHKPICVFLMDQSRFSGIGNYLKSEILYRSAIRPDRTLDSLSDNEIETLRVKVLETIYEAFMARGLTIKDYWDPAGKRGVFKLKVYQKKTDPLGHKVHRGEFGDGRTSFWVPEVQQ